MPLYRPKSIGIWQYTDPISDPPSGGKQGNSVLSPNIIRSSRSRRVGVVVVGVVVVGVEGVVGVGEVGV
jgi:hypothetical protein